LMHASAIRQSAEVDGHVNLPELDARVGNQAIS